MSPNPQDDYAIAAGLYDHVVPYANRPDVAFCVDAARDAAGPVLELGCGTGRIPAARAGCDITGLDASPRMLEICAARLPPSRRMSAGSPHWSAATCAASISTASSHW